jgi:hypothetical protein
MGAVHISIRHDDDPMVAKPTDIKIICPNPGAQRGDQGTHFFRGQHLVEPGFLYVQNFSFKR